MKRICVADAEANGLLETVDTIHCVVFKDRRTKEVFKFHHGQPNWEKKCQEFMDSCDTLIMHNGIGYDFPLFRKVWGYEYKGRKVDTLLISRLHNPDRRLPPNCPNKRAGPHSVEAWGYRVGRGKPDHSDWETYSDAMLHRCTEDVEIQDLIVDALHAEGRSNDWKDAYSLTFALFDILQRQEEYGWLVDVPYMERCIGMLTHWMERIDKVVTPHLPLVMEIKETKKEGEYNYVKKPFKKDGGYSAVTERFIHESGYDITTRPVMGCFSRISFRRSNIDSGDEMKAFLLKEGWIPDKWNYQKDPKTKRPIKNGAGQLVRASPKLDQSDPFLGLEGKVGKLIAKRIQVRHRRSNIEGWMKLVRADGRIAARVSGIATTGRMKHAGIVNVPSANAFFGKQMRKCFIAKKGWSLIGTDAASCQDRMLADRAGVQEFTDMLLHGDKSKGTDGHSLAMKAVNRALTKWGLPLINRSKGKNFNFGWKFGASDNKLGEMGGGKKALGEDIRQELFDVFPAQAALLEKLTAEWRSTAKKKVNDWGKLDYYNGTIKGLDGRPILISSEHQILVYMLQSDEAIYMSGVYCIAYKDLCKRFRWGEDFGIVCFYHDEITVEVKDEYAEEAARIIENAFTKASNYFKFEHCPQAGEAEIGSNWYDIH